AAEHTVGLALAAANELPQHHQALKRGEYDVDADALSQTVLEGGTHAIIGLGRVGQRVARRFESLGMDIVAYDPYIGRDRAAELGVTLVDDLDRCLARADSASIHVPLTAETENLIGEAELAHLEGGYFVHTARGGVVDESALADACASGHLAGAAVDVFVREPVPRDNPLLQVDSIVVTPHLGGTTYTAQERVARTAAEQVIAAFENEPVSNALNLPWSTPESAHRVRRYIDLAETASQIAFHLFDSRVEWMEATYAGDIAEERDIELVTARAFEPFGWQIPVVNAPSRIADRRGVDVSITREWRASEFQSLVSVAIGDDDGRVSVGGTLLGDDTPHIVSIDDYRLDAVPHTHMLVVRNEDTPGVIGSLGTILGDHDVNIASMANSRRPIDGRALTIYNLDDPLPRTAHRAIADDERVSAVEYIELE
ncbi:MAG: NAD(P)-dependent oxidoreductase, partial [Halanaeroarchaeum sp.]